MKSLLGFVFLALIACPLLASDPAGTVPRNNAGEYPAHTKAKGVAIGARVLTQKEVHQNFSTNLNDCCLVVEVAIYPATGKSLNVSLNNFNLRIGLRDRSIKPSSAGMLAAQLQERNSAPAKADVTIYPEAHVGYESGIDPITGRRVHGAVYGGGVGVGVGQSPGASTPPASTRADREVMALELGEKGIPQGETAVPVAGYVYFSMSKKDRKAAHRLKYILNRGNLLLDLQ